MYAPLHHVQRAPMTFRCHRLCSITFRTSTHESANLLEEQSAAVMKLSACHCECAVHQNAAKHACGEVFIYTSRSDREAFVQRACFAKPHLRFLQLLWRECTGLPFYKVTFIYGVSCSVYSLLKSAQPFTADRSFSHKT